MAEVSSAPRTSTSSLSVPDATPAPTHHPAYVRSSHSPPARFEFVSASSALGSPTVKRVSKVYATTAEAIAHFKPTPREVISGIAPHVFDERKRRRSSSRERSKPKPYSNSSWRYGQKRSSPLRGAMIISWDEHSIYLEQPTGNAQDDVDARVVGEKTSSGDDADQSSPTQEMHHDEKGTADAQQCAITTKRSSKHTRSGWRYLRVDIHLLKSVVEKLKFSNSQNTETA